jgi:hypothetical protein
MCNKSFSFEISILLLVLMQEVIIESNSTTNANRNAIYRELAWFPQTEKEAQRQEWGQEQTFFSGNNRSRCVFIGGTGNQTHSVNGRRGSMVGANDAMVTIPITN